MADYRSIIASAVSHLPRADEARHAIYERARIALHERLGNDPQISDTELENEHHRLEVAIYEVEEDLLLNEMRRFVTEGAALSSPRLSFISRVKKFGTLTKDEARRVAANIAKLPELRLGKSRHARVIR